MKKAICRLCGKEGILTSFPFRGSTMTVLKHYCPVKAEKRKFIKQAELKKEVDAFLKRPVEEVNTFLVEGELYRRYPHKEEDILAVFKGITYTDEEVAAQNAFKEARKRLQQAIYDYVKKHRKFPTTRRYQLILEKV